MSTHPPIHAHVLHPNGKAVISLDGDVSNSGVPDKILLQARTWILANTTILLAEWQKMNNPVKR